MISLNRGGLSVTAHFDLAEIYAVLGEKSKAIKHLQSYNKAIGEYETWYMIWLLRNDPLLNNIRNEPEFQSVSKELEEKYQKNHEIVRKWLEENNML